MVVNASSARVGGAMTYLREMLPELGRCLAAEGGRLTVLLGSSAALELNDVLASGHIATHSSAWMGWHGMLRTTAEQIQLPLALRRLRGSVLLGVGDTVPLARTVPSVVLCRNALIYRPHRATPRLRLLRLVASLSVKRATKVAAVSRTLADILQAETHRADIDVVYHGPGLRLGGYAKHHEDWRILCVGSLDEHKRFELAIEAVRMLRLEGYPARLRIVGSAVDRQYEQRLIDCISKSNLEDAVSLVGSCDPIALQEEYARADALLITSRMESFCHPILEGFQTRTPVVAVQDLAIAAEIGGDGLLLSAPTATALAAAAKALRENLPMRDRLLDAASRRLAAFSWQRSAECLVRVLEQAVSG